MEKLITIILTELLVLCISSAAIANQTNKTVFWLNNNSYSINGNQLIMDEDSFIANGRIFLPIRYLAYACGLTDNSIKWDQNSDTVTLTKDNTTVSLALGSSGLDVNGNYTNMDVTPLNVNGHIFIPARWVAQAYGYNVSWDQTNRTVTIINGNSSTQKNVTKNNDTTNYSTTNKDTPTFNLPTSIKTVAITDDTPASFWWVPNNQNSVLSQVSSWLNTAIPYAEEIPQSQNVGPSNGYVGPSRLYITTSDKKDISIYPAYYEGDNGKTDNATYEVNGVITKTEIPEYQTQCVQDVLVFDNGENITYLKSEPLYNWLKNDEWKSEFVPKTGTPVNIN